MDTGFRRMAYRRLKPSHPAAAIQQISPIRTSKSICSSAPGNKISKASPDGCNWLFVRFSGKTSLRRGTFTLPTKVMKRWNQIKKGTILWSIPSVIATANPLRISSPKPKSRRSSGQNKQAARQRSNRGKDNKPVYQKRSVASTILRFCCCSICQTVTA